MQRIVDWGERIFVVLLLMPFFVSFYRYLPVNIWAIAIVLTETITVILILIRRQGAISVEPAAVLAAFMGTGLPLLVRPDADPNFPNITGPIMVAGLVLSVWAKLALNRRFGAVPANRGVQAHGPYSIVRHPIYLGYLITHIAFLVSTPSLWNVFVYAFAWLFQIVRIFKEEQFLGEDNAYRVYASRVRHRMLPGVF
jgi:protein-S-isoprenylcysteine O-methyltransferase Ste14